VSFLSDIHAREQRIEVEVAATADGELLAMRAGITAGVGPYSAYPRSSVVEGGQVPRLLPGPYRVRHYEATLRVVAQNRGITSQYRPRRASDRNGGDGGDDRAPAAILNAVNDALAPWGVVLTEQPLTSERVWRALEAARTRRDTRAASA